MPSEQQLRDNLVERATRALPICADFVVEIEGMIDAAPAATWAELVEMHERLTKYTGAGRV